MAFSQPLSASIRQKGQTAMLCQLCEIDPKLKWKCLDCGLLMCQRCRDKIHPKFASAEDHTIVDIKEISKHKTDTEPKLDFTKLKCDAHTGKTCCMFCKTCHELVCQTCIAKTHNKHDFGEINDEYHTKLEKVINKQQEIVREKQKLEIQKQKLKQIKSTQQSEYDKVKQEIHENEKALVNQIKEHTHKLIQELGQKWEVFSNTIEDEIKNLEEKMSQIQNQMQEIHNLLQASNAKKVFSQSESFIQSLSTKISQINISFQGVPRLTDVDQTKISLTLGTLEDVSIEYKTNLQVEKTFETDLKNIFNVVSCPDGSLWISDMFTGVIQKVKPDADKISVISNFKITLGNSSLLPSGDLLFSNKGSPILKLIPSGSTDIQDSVYTVSPLLPTGIHVTCDNQVIVGAAGGQSFFPASGPRQVIVMDQTGHQEKVFQYDRHNKPLFTVPFRITSDRRGNVAVIDTVSDDHRGRVVVLNEEGESRNIYKGHLDVNNEDNPFTPGDITTTPSDNFVVADWNNHTLHILNSEGDIITFHNTEKMGILLPFSLSFSTTGQLYIGCATLQDSKEKAKLYQVDNFFL